MKRSIEERINRIIETETIQNAIIQIQGYMEQFYWNRAILNILAELHFKNEDFAQAGKYWFFKENKTEDEKKCVLEYQSSLGFDDRLIARNFIGVRSKSPAKFDHYTKENMLNILESITETEGKLPRFAINWYNHLVKIRNY